MERTYVAPYLELIGKAHAIRENVLDLGWHGKITVEIDGPEFAALLSRLRDCDATDKFVDAVEAKGEYEVYSVRFVRKETEADV